MADWEFVIIAVSVGYAAGSSLMIAAWEISSRAALARKETP